MKTFFYARSTKLLGTVVAALLSLECRGFAPLSRPVARSTAAVKPAGHVLLHAQQVDEAESSTTAGCETLECLLARPLTAARSDEDRELRDRVCPTCNSLSAPPDRFYSHVFVFCVPRPLRLCGA